MKTDPFESSNPRRSLVAAGCYFAIVFATGFLLGIVRVIWLLPALGDRAAELLELPLMILVSWIVAGRVVQSFRIGNIQQALLVGGIAASVLILIELTVVLTIRGLSVDDYLASRDPIAGSAYLLSLVLFAIFPALRTNFPGSWSCPWK